MTLFTEEEEHAIRRNPLWLDLGNRCGVLLANAAERRAAGALASVMRAEGAGSGEIALFIATHPLALRTYMDDEP